jgi:hypothetical protein
MITEVNGNLVKHWSEGNIIGVTTNGFVKEDGRCVMGAGIAKSIRDAVPDIDLEVGEHIVRNGNVPAFFPAASIFTFPVKHVWWENADLDLIYRSAQYIACKNLTRIDIPRPGCGNGKLDWSDVKPVLEKAFGDRRVHVWDF